MQTFRTQPVPKDFDFRLVRILEELQTAVQDHNTGLSLISKGLTPDQQQKPLPTDPAITDHGKLDGLVPILNADLSVQDPNDDHSQYLLLMGRIGGQTGYGSRLGDPRIVASAGKAFTFAQNKVAGASWASIVVRQDAPVGQLVVLALGTDDIAATGSTNTHTTITDSVGNTWTKHAEYTRQFSAGFGACVSIWTSVLGFAHVAGTTTLTANFSGSVAAKSMEGWQFLVPTGAVVTLQSSITDGANSGSNAPSLVLSGLTSGTYLFVRADANESDTIEAWTNDGGYTPFDQNDTDKSQSATTGGAQRSNSATRAEFRIFTGTGTSTQPIFNISDFQIIASALVALKVSVPGVGSLLLKSINNLNAGTLWLDDEMIHLRGDGSATNRLVAFEDENGTELSYIRSTDGAFIGPIAPTPQFALLNTTLFNDVVAAPPVRGDLIVANSTPKWTSLPKGVFDQLLQVDGSGDVVWTEVISILDLTIGSSIHVTAGAFPKVDITSSTITIETNAPNVPSIVLQNNAGATAVFQARHTVADARIGTTSAHDFSLMTGNTNQFTVSSGGLISLMPPMGDDILMRTFNLQFGASDQSVIDHDGTDLRIDASNGSTTAALLISPTVRSSGNYSARQQILKIAHSALQGGTTNTTAQTIALGTGLATDVGLSATQFGMAQGLDLTVTNTNTTKAGLPKASVAPYVLSLAFNADTGVIGAVDASAIKIASTFTTASSNLQTNLLATVSGNSTSVAALTGVQGCQFLATNTTAAAGDARGFTGYGNLNNAAATGRGIGVFGYGAHSGNGTSALAISFLADTAGSADSRQNYDIVGTHIAIHGALWLTTTLNLKSSNPSTHLTLVTGSAVPAHDLFVSGQGEIDDTLWTDKVGDALVFAEGGNIVLGTTTGTKVGTATTQKLGFFNTAPIVQPAALTAQLTAITFTAPGTPDYAIADLTNVAPYGFVSQDEGRTVLSVIANLQTRVQELETKLSTAAGGVGLIA